MPGIGDTLREARMRQRLDIADVEAKTKIRAKYLRALENEEFGLLPGPTFVRTFLRSYAEVLGLDPQRLVQEYRTQHEPDDELDQLQPLGPPSARRERRGPRPPGPGTVAVLAVIALIGLLLVLGLTGEDGEGDGGERAQETTTTERRERPRQRERRPRPAPTSVTLRVTPSEPTYACVDTGAETEVLFEGTLEAARTFRGRVLRVNLGKSSVDMRANGRRVPLEPSPNPVGWEFTPDDMREIPIGERPCA